MGESVFLYFRPEVYIWYGCSFCMRAVCGREDVCPPKIYAVFFFLFILRSQDTCALFLFIAFGVQVQRG